MIPQVCGMDRPLLKHLLQILPEEIVQFGIGSLTDAHGGEGRQ
jgi:hypothetical protein